MSTESDLLSIELFSDGLEAIGGEFGEFVEIYELVSLAKDIEEILNKPRDVEESLDNLNNVISGIEVALTLASKAPAPIGTLASLLEKVVDQAHDDLVKVENRADEVADDVDGVVDAAVPDDGMDPYYEAATDLILTATQYAADLEDRAAAMNRMLLAQSVIGTPMDQILSDTADAIDPIVDADGDGNSVILSAYSAAKAVNDGVDAITSTFENAVFDAISDGLDMVAELLDYIGFLEGPLDLLTDLLEPIEGVLDAIGFVFDLLVAPVVDFIVEELGIDDLLDTAADAISALVPDLDFMDGLLGLLDDIEAHFGTMVNLATEIQASFDQVIQDVLTPLQETELGATYIGTSFDEDKSSIQPDQGTYFDLLEGNDIATGSTVTDVFMSSEGDDTVIGGDGDDYLVLQGGVVDWTFGVLEDDTLGADPIQFTHLGSDGLNLGGERAYEIEYFVFSEDGLELSFDILTSAVLVDTGDFDGSDGGDYIFAGGASTINGGLGDDRMTGSDQDDMILGGSGNDALVVTQGNDTLIGGIGEDNLVLAETSSGAGIFVVNLENAFYHWDDGGSLTDEGLVAGVENVVLESLDTVQAGGDGGDNKLISGGGSTTLYGGDGNDTLLGGYGNDYLIGGRGRDEIDGGQGSDDIFAVSDVTTSGGSLYIGGDNLASNAYDGYDSIYYGLTSVTSNVVLADAMANLGFDTLQGSDTSLVMRTGANGSVEHYDSNGNLVAEDTLDGFEFFYGSDNDDVIYGYWLQDGTNQLPNSFVDGGGGKDTIYTESLGYANGGDDDDIIYATRATANYHIQFLQGNDGFDRLDLTMLENARFVSNDGRSFDVYSIEVSPENAGLGDTFMYIVGTDFEHVSLGQGQDDITITDQTPDERIFDGLGGNDRLVQSLVLDDTKSSILNGGAGDDELAITAQGQAKGGSGNDTLSVETDQLPVTLSGGQGDDIVYLHQIGFGLGGLINGGAGLDTLSLGADPTANILSLADKVFSNGTILKNFEVVIGSDGFDVIEGSSNGEQLAGQGSFDDISGLGGADIIYGGAGGDTLNGGNKGDTLHGGADGDQIDGGGGNDTASYANIQIGTADGSLIATDFLNFYVNLGDDGGYGAEGYALDSDGAVDSLTSIENVIGSRGNDTLIGDDGGNALTGGWGDDSLEGMGGQDVLILGEGTEIANGGDGKDLIVLGAGDGFIDGGNGRDTLNLGTVASFIELDFGAGLVRSTFAPEIAVWVDDGTTDARLWNGDLITPDMILRTDINYAQSEADLTQAVPNASESDELYAIELAEGTETILTTVFSDIEVIVNDFVRVFIQLTNNKEVYDGTQGQKDILDLSSLFGISFDLEAGDNGLALLAGDNLTGIDGVMGTAGADTLLGNDAANEIYGGDRADVIESFGGSDYIEGGAGADLIDAGGFADTVDGGAGKDTVTGGKGADLIDLGAGQDVFLDDAQGGGNGSDTVTGGAGDDLIEVGGGDNLISGDGGNDTFVLFGLSGVSTILDFEIGIDRLDFVNWLEIGALGDLGMTDTDSGVLLTDIAEQSAGSLLLAGLSSGDLLTSDFDFV